MGNQVIRQFEGVDVVGCWDEETPEDAFDFYDLYLDTECINEGNPFYGLPTDEEIRDAVKYYSEGI